jgi:hypothetical protein
LKPIFNTKPLPFPPLPFLTSQVKHKFMFEKVFQSFFFFSYTFLSSFINPHSIHFCLFWYDFQSLLTVSTVDVEIFLPCKFLDGIKQLFH